MNRRRLFKALGAALALPLLPKVAEAVEVTETAGLPEKWLQGMREPLAKGYWEAYNMAITPEGALRPTPIDGKFPSEGAALEAAKNADARARPFAMFRLPPSAIMALGELHKLLIT